MGLWLSLIVFSLYVKYVFWHTLLLTQTSKGGFTAWAWTLPSSPASCRCSNAIDTVTNDFFSVICYWLLDIWPSLEWLEASYWWPNKIFWQKSDHTLKNGFIFKKLKYTYWKSFIWTYHTITHYSTGCGRLDGFFFCSL